MEGIIQLMVFFLGVRVLLSQKDKETEAKDEDMGKRGKRKNKWKNKQKEDSEVLAELISSSSTTDEKPKKPYENYKLPPPRDAQDGKV